MSTPRHAATMSIGSVLDLLRTEFPDITISKIRFLESEGLISPQRAPSGYRRFCLADCDRLRFVLTAQRDRYLPLKVIKEQLAAMDSGEVAVVEPASTRGPRRLGAVSGEVSAADFRTERAIRITREDLCKRAGIDEAFLKELLGAGMIVPGPGGYFDEDAVAVATLSAALSRFGLEARHLRTFKTAAEREAGLITQIAGPMARLRDAGARDRAEEVVRELAALSVRLHTHLVRTAVRGSLDA